MRASSPTGVCASRSAGRLPRFVGEGHGPPALRSPGWPQPFRLVRDAKMFVGAGFIPPAGPCGGASRADMESAPTGGCVCARLHCRAGVHARRTAAIQNRDVRNAAGCGGMRASRPTAARAAAAVPVGPIRKNIRRGGIYCARRRVSEANRRAAAALRPEIPPAGPCGGASRADMESAPTEVCVCAGVCVTRLAADLPPKKTQFLIPHS